MTADHKAALEWAERVVTGAKGYPLNYKGAYDLAAAYLELRKLAKAACDAHDPNWMPALRAAIGEE